MRGDYKTPTSVLISLVPERRDTFLIPPKGVESSESGSRDTGGGGGGRKGEHPGRLERRERLEKPPAGRDVSS